jgi:hypothetical protein
MTITNRARATGFGALVAATAATVGTALLLALPATATAATGFEPPDPCRACGGVHIALNPQPLPPGRARLSSSDSA